MKTRPLSAALLSLAATILLAPLVPGCGGEAPPPPMDASKIEDLQKKQQEIISKEYGPNVGKAAKKR
ncbi:hypothetical protein [Paludisphaera mucosa]|uniref:Secreted protein n=1 Tax=Paludisphaera mucosa TaxID=3030827 RepID=A0ABT6FKF1_9BACT|nr:hypothetical protein [Paludisphaera mucosa]MDG3008056.1 hypothetical protein [Paludisphaera mucosa]